MELKTISLFFLICACVSFRPSSVFAANQDPPPVLNVDCSFTGPTGDLCKEETEEWAKERNVKVHVIREILTSTEKLKRYTRILNSNSPDMDVFGVDVIWPGVFHKYLLDLGPYFTESLSQFLPVYIENNTVNGRLLAIPLSLSIGLLYYRTDLLTKYGAKVPDTWEELTATAAMIQNKERASGNKDLWGYVFQGKPYEGLTCNALEWIASYKGGNILDRGGRVLVNTANVLEAMTMASGWIGKISPKETLGFAEKESHMFFRSGKAVFLRAWPSALNVVLDGDSPIKDKVGFALIPKGGEHGIHSSTLGGWSLAISAKSKNPALAADLLKYLTGPKEQKRRALLAGAPPTLNSLYQDPDVLKAAPYNGILLPMFTDAALRPSRIVRNAYPMVSEEFWKEIHLILEGKDTPLQGISKLQNKLEKLSTSWRR